MNLAWRVLVLLVLSQSARATPGETSASPNHPESKRSKTQLTTSWRFHLGDPEQSFFRADLDDSTWQIVSIPHTLKLTDLNLDGCHDDKTQPTFHRTVGWYRRTIEVIRKSGKVFLEFGLPIK